MSKKRVRRHGRGRARPPAREKRSRDRPAAVAAGALALALLASGLLFDRLSASPFDAPKRLACLMLIALAAGALAFSPAPRLLGALRRKSPASFALGLLLCALLLAATAAVFSARRPLALDTLRALLLWALLLPLGASRVLERHGRFLLGVFLCVLAFNAAVSLAQARGLYHPFALETEPGSRESTGAFVGNVGYLSVALALSAVAALALLLEMRQAPARRAAAGFVLLLTLAATLVNQNLTSLSALLVGAVVLLFAAFGRRAAWPAIAAVFLLAVAVAAYAPMRGRVAAAVGAARAGNWNELVTYRLGPWRAALEMIRERPILGFGPGTFGAEFVAHRLRAEIAAHQRLDNPFLTGTYEEAHCDYLEPFAQAGVPAGLAALGAVVCLFWSLCAAARRASGFPRAEAIFLLAFLAAAATAAWTWFPLQRPISAIPLLLAAGRAWRISIPPGRPAADAQLSQ